MIIVDYNPFTQNGGVVIRFNDETNHPEGYIQTDSNIESLAEKTLEICETFNDFVVKFRHNLPDDYQEFCDLLAAKQRAFSSLFSIDVEEI